MAPCACNVCVHAHVSAPCSGKKQGNRLSLIRKLMHRKARQRHCSPSARGAGENNLHIARLMDTFIGSTDRGMEGERERMAESGKREGL